MPGQTGSHDVRPKRDHSLNWAPDNRQPRPTAEKPTPAAAAGHRQPPQTAAGAAAATAAGAADAAAAVDQIPRLRPGLSTSCTSTTDGRPSPYAGDLVETTPPSSPLGPLIAGQNRRLDRPPPSTITPPIPATHDSTPAMERK